MKTFFRLKALYSILAVWVVIVLELLYAGRGGVLFFISHSVGYILSDYEGLQKKGLSSFSIWLYLLWWCALIHASAKTIHSGSREDVANMIFFLQVCLVGVTILVLGGFITVLSDFTLPILSFSYVILAGLEGVVVFAYIRKVIPSLSGVVTVCLICFWPFNFFKRLFRSV
jgi:hypothetical protein